MSVLFGRLPLICLNSRYIDELSVDNFGQGMRFALVAVPERPGCGQVTELGEGFLQRFVSSFQLPSISMTRDSPAVAGGRNCGSLMSSVLPRQARSERLRQWPRMTATSAASRDVN